jgi:hypothetical protein
MNDSDSTSTENLPLHEQVQNHLQTCSKCQSVLEARKRVQGLGQRIRLCSEYIAILQNYANNEGRVNNIVDHDEYGNQASTAVHETYPDQWR